MITFILLGDEITRQPTTGKFLQVPRSYPLASALCFARIAAARQVTTEYFSIVDGGPDILLPNFELGIEQLCDKLTTSGVNIGSARSQTPAHPEGRYMQHSVVCRTSAFNSLHLPESGCFHFETMVYTMLADEGVAEHNEILYQWIPSPNGANDWADTRFARVNGYRWAHGLTPLVVPQHFLKYPI